MLLCFVKEEEKKELHLIATLHLDEAISETKNTTDLPAAAEAAAKMLNFDHHDKLFDNLEPLEVDESILARTMAVKRLYKPSARPGRSASELPRPKLDDFHQPYEGRDVKLLPKADDDHVKRVRVWHHQTSPRSRPEDYDSEDLIQKLRRWQAL